MMIFTRWRSCALLCFACVIVAVSAIPYEERLKACVQRTYCPCLPEGEACTTEYEPGMRFDICPCCTSTHNVTEAFLFMECLESESPTDDELMELAEGVLRNLTENHTYCNLIRTESRFRNLPARDFDKLFRLQRVPALLQNLSDSRRLRALSTPSEVLGMFGNEYVVVSEQASVTVDWKNITFREHFQESVLGPELTGTVDRAFACRYSGNATCTNEELYERSCGGGDCVHLNGTHWRKQSGSIEVKNIRNLPSDTWYFFGDHSLEPWESYVQENYVSPKWGVNLRPAFGVSNSLSGVGFHTHGSGFAEVLWGGKVWFLWDDWKTTEVPGYKREMRTLDWMIWLYFHPHRSSMFHDSEFAREAADSLMKAYDFSVENNSTFLPPAVTNREHHGLYMCFLEPGYNLFFPGMMPHATFNIGSSRTSQPSKASSLLNADRFRKHVNECVIETGDDDCPEELQISPFDRDLMAVEGYNVFISPFEDEYSIERMRERGELGVDPFGGGKKFETY